MFKTFYILRKALKELNIYKYSYIIDKFNNLFLNHCLKFYKIYSNNNFIFNLKKI